VPRRLSVGPVAAPKVPAASPRAGPVETRIELPTMDLEAGLNPVVAADAAADDSGKELRPAPRRCLAPRCSDGSRSCRGRRSTRWPP
jgi:hypothetical protein